MDSSPDKPTKTISLTLENAFDAEYKARMQAEGYTITDSKHSRIILEDVHFTNPAALSAARTAAKEALALDPSMESVTITNTSGSQKEIVVPDDQDDYEANSICVMM
jgi:hypothetical protein